MAGLPGERYYLRARNNEPNYGAETDLDAKGLLIENGGGEMSALND